HLVHAAVVALVALVLLALFAGLPPAAGGLHQAIGVALVLGRRSEREQEREENGWDGPGHLHRLFFRMILASAFPIFRLSSQSAQAPAWSPRPFLAQPRLL